MRRKNERRVSLHNVCKIISFITFNDPWNFSTILTIISRAGEAKLLNLYWKYDKSIRDVQSGMTIN